MHRLSILALALLFLHPAAAQIGRGQWLISLNNFFDASTYDVATPIPQPAQTALLRYEPERTLTTLAFGGSGGYALWERLVIGTGVTGYVNFREGAYSGATFTPFVRYYPINRPHIMAFAELRSRVGVGNSVGVFRSVTPAIGMQVPVGGAVLFTPRITIGAPGTKVQLLLGLEARIGERPEEGPVVATLRRGQFMLGGQSGILELAENGHGTGLTLGSHYLLTDRLAVGASAGLGHAVNRFETGGGDRLELAVSSLQLAVAARYYLSGGQRVLYYTEAGGGRVWARVDTDLNNVVLPDVTDNFLNLGAGAQYYLRSNLALEAGPQVRFDFTTDQWIYGLNTGLRILL